MNCGKWRLLEEKDPARIEENWKCCEHATPEQSWEASKAWVENCFTVGSLVWAQIPGFSEWPAMVDDCPDTGTFFWTGVHGDDWALKPFQYHVVFFQENSVSRAWVASNSVTRFASKKLNNVEKKDSKLVKAVAMAEIAASKGLEERRSKYCFAARWRGVWGPVWPGWGQGHTEDPVQEVPDLNMNGMEPSNTAEEEKQLSAGYANIAMPIPDLVSDYPELFSQELSEDLECSPRQVSELIVLSTCNFLCPLIQVSFQSELADSSIIRNVEHALFVAADSETPRKKSLNEMENSVVNVVESTPLKYLEKVLEVQDYLHPPASPACSTPCRSRKSPFHPYTPRSGLLNAQPSPVAHLVVPSPLNKQGSSKRLCLDNTAGSNAVSADGSFTDL